MSIASNVACRHTHHVSGAKRPNVRDASGKQFPRRIPTPESLQQNQFPAGSARALTL